MELHFYTSWESIQMFIEGLDISVWTKEAANSGDVHISLNVNEYSLERISPVLFHVSIK